MILYLDTSSLVKLYIAEEHSDRVHGWAEQAEILCTSRVALPEAFAALSKRHRAGDLTPADFEAARRALQTQWISFAIVRVDEIAAAELTLRHPLRGFDAIHLAAALELAEDSGTEVRFTSFDRQLNRAVRAEGLEVLDSMVD